VCETLQTFTAIIKDETELNDDDALVIAHDVLVYRQADPRRDVATAPPPAPEQD
jgi:hypothetical protein